MLTFKWDLDDELSQLYLRKDMDNFWKKWQNISLKEILLHFMLEAMQSLKILHKEAFYNASFNSYSDASLKVRLGNLDMNVIKTYYGVSTLIKRKVCEEVYVTANIAKIALQSVKRIQWQV